MCWRWQCGIKMHHHDLVVIIPLQTHPTKLVSFWCMAPTLWCKDLLFLLRKVQTSSAHPCPSDTHPSQSCFSAIARIIFILRLANTRILWNLLKIISIIIVTVFRHKCWQSTNLPCSMHELCHAAWPPSGLLSHSYLLVPSLLTSHLPNPSHHYNWCIIECQHPLSSCMYQRQNACLPWVPRWFAYYLHILDPNLAQGGKLCVNIYYLNWCWACSSICNSSMRHTLKALDVVM